MTPSSIDGDATGFTPEESGSSPERGSPDTERGKMMDKLPYHRWPRSWGGWQAGSIIRCEGKDCEFCRMRWTLVDPTTFKNIQTQSEEK
jgi:hypothetical protein